MPLKILFVSSEVTPFSKTGGLADVSQALPKALKKLGCDIRILTPLYGIIDTEKYRIAPLKSFQDISIALDHTIQKISFDISSDDTSLSQTYFIDFPALYERQGIYMDIFSSQDYVDNDYRFILLSKAGFELCQRLNWIPDIIHCNDWQTSLIPFYHRFTEHGKGFEKSKTVLTIHNMAYHGLFPRDTLHRIGGAESLFYPQSPLEFYEKVNFLKAGITLANRLTTVSPTYAREIQSAYEFGYGLENILRDCGQHLTGILNGIDDEVWNPKTDTKIPQTYDTNSIELKEKNKKELCRRMNLKYDENIPVIAIISRIAHQKGFEILAPILQDILHLPAKFVALGSGDPHYEHMLMEYSRIYPDYFSAKIGYDEDLSHLIEAGADIFLMPSLFEPCGLNQMMSMRYGTLPVVRATGGLADTVIDADYDSTRGTGFMFMDYHSQALLHSIKRAVHHYRNKPHWRHLQRNAMSTDFSWKVSAEKYLRLYEECLSS